MHAAEWLALQAAFEPMARTPDACFSGARLTRRVPRSVSDSARRDRKSHEAAANKREAHQQQLARAEWFEWYPRSRRTG